MARHREIHNLGDDDMYDYDEDYDYYDESYVAPKPNTNSTNSSGAKVTGGGGKKRRKKKSGAAQQQQQQQKQVEPKEKDATKNPDTSGGIGQQKKPIVAEDIATPSTEAVEGKLSVMTINLEKDNLVTEVKEKVSDKVGKKTIALLEEFAKQQSEKPELNLVVIGHVDSGKSTLMGHILYKLGCVNKKLMRKYEHESKTIGKGSFAYAWVLDEQGEERERGITVDVAMKSFFTDNRKITLLDAPGHKDFIHNMISGAAQADVAILVIDSVKGAFEAGFDHGGQTREHALLVKSLGISQLIVAVNKMDQCGWEIERFREILDNLKPFLNQIGFKDEDLYFIPISGLEGINLVERITDVKWYEGPCLIKCIDTIQPPSRAVEKPLRFCVSGVNLVGGSIHVAGKIETGYFQTGDKLLAMPAGQTAVVRSILAHDESVQSAMAGANVQVVVAKIDLTDLSIGSVLCPIQYPVPVAIIIVAKLVVMNTDRAITRGYTVELYYQSVCEPATVCNLISQVHKSSGEVIKQRPKALPKNSSGVVEIEPLRPICVETFEDCKELGRLALRSNGKTVAIGIILDITAKGNKDM